VFGLVLLGLGAIGRKRDDAAAASNVVQALALLSLALVLKLDGYHLVLALAGESLALALAFHRFRGRAECAFAMLAGIGAAWLTFMPISSALGPMPLGSGLLATGCVAAAALLVRHAVERVEPRRASDVRAVAAVLAYSALVLLICGVLMRLPEAWKLPSAAGLSAAFAAVSFGWDRKRRMPEAAWASGILCLVAFMFLDEATPVLGQVVTVAAALAACAWWHRPVPVKGGPLLAADPAVAPQAFAWLQALFVPVACGKLLERGHFSENVHLIALAAGAVGLVAIARGLKATRLETTGQLLNLGALLTVVGALSGSSAALAKPLAFSPPLAAAAILAITTCRRENPSRARAAFARAILFLGWAVAMAHAVPRGFTDLMALSAAAAFVWAWKRRIAAPVEAWGWTAASFGAYLLVLVGGTRTRFHGYEFEGLALVVLMAGIALVTPRVPAVLQRFTARALPWLACGWFTLWSTHLVVDRFGWKAVAVLWTVSGFGLVTLGLVLSRITSRQAGFLLLGLALLKLFAVDVWDFTTFMRVVSFLALGLALVLLGLFYHRFAPAVKRLLEEETPDP
jgi:hypothetical protein